MNKQLVITRQGNVNTDWVFDNSMELLLILLGMIMVLWLCFLKGSLSVRDTF